MERWEIPGCLAFGARGIRKVKKKWGEYNVLHGAALHRLATVYYYLGQNDKAEAIYPKAIEIRAKVLGKEHPDYAWSLNNFAALFESKGDYSNAEPLLEEAKEIWAKALGKVHPNYATSLNNLAGLYFSKGDYPKAELFYLEAKEICEESVGKENPLYGAILIGLADIYIQTGAYDKAELLSLEAKEIRAKVLGMEHEEYAGSLSMLAALYRYKGDYTRAEILYLEALNRYSNTVGKESTEYATILNNLGSMYFDKRDYSKAEMFFLESKELRSKILGKNHPFYAMTLNNLSNVYTQIKNYHKAELLGLEALAIRATAQGKEHPDYAMSLTNLAIMYLDMGEYDKAESMALEAKDILTITLGKNCFRYSNALYSLAKLCQLTDRIQESIDYFLEKNEVDRSLIERAVAYSSENQMVAYLQTFEDGIAEFCSIAQNFPNSKITSENFNNALLFNGFLLENSRHLARSISKADSLTVETYERWQGCRRRLSNEYAKPIAERRFIAEVEAESYEKTLARNLPTFSETRHAPRWQEVQTALRPGEAAVEFVHYEYYTSKATDSTMYAALVLRPADTQPQFIPLFEKNELKDLMRGASGGSNFLKINALYSQKSLYDLIWKPLEPMLTGIKTVYFAPSGLLHRLNLAAITTPEGQVYGDRRQLVVLGSTRQLVTPNSNLTSVNDAYLAGGIRYESDSTAITYANRGASTRSIEHSDLAFQPDSLSITRGGVLDYLPATATEVREIGQTLRSAGLEAKIDTGFYATEESFRLLGIGSSSPRIIHLATHGYFFPDPVASGSKQLALGSEREPVFKMSEHPMIRSGMIMAGAKQAWLTGKHPEGMEDGILTAYEISQMNLSGTELVVLSACETGLGDIVGNEGVYGLQRAFKIAGAKYLIMSLWKVDDRSTRAFMTSFYRHWLTEKQTVPEAFRSTQREMRVKYSGAYDWAGFVLIE